KALQKLAIRQFCPGERGGESPDVAHDRAFLRDRHSLTPPWPHRPSCLSAARLAAVFGNSFSETTSSTKRETRSRATDAEVHGKRGAALPTAGQTTPEPPSEDSWPAPSRTWAGARAQSVLMSVWRTCWQQGRSAVDFLSQLLRGAPVPLALPP